MTRSDRRYNYHNLTPLHSIEEHEETDFNSVGKLRVFGVAMVI